MNTQELNIPDRVVLGIKEIRETSYSSIEDLITALETLNFSLVRNNGPVIDGDYILDFIYTNIDGKYFPMSVYVMVQELPEGIFYRPLYIEQVDTSKFKGEKTSG